jgi:hypothetical protein
VDINLVPDQMKIFDTLNSTDASVTVIDVRSDLMSGTLRALRDISFIDAAKIAVFHILGPTIASLDEIANTAAYLGDARYFLVKNFINDTHFQWGEWARGPAGLISNGSRTRSKSGSRSSVKWQPNRWSSLRSRS